ncbi:MAG TPA: hypothetical protein VJY35_11600 [Candidatus Eisenbacteria bacterium]|nr:hypothetical protein [Candidatus Eisenbacteria bacterium]
MRIIRAGLVSVIALLALSCASANRLSQRSERALEAGDLRGAYEQARRAIEKQPNHPRARAAYTTAATRLVDDKEARILSIADVDTLAAAEQILELVDLRGDILQHNLTLPPDTLFARHETAIRVGAADVHYRAGARAMTERTPKTAWFEFQKAQRMVPGYRDTEKRIDQAFDQALARVAILPFEDQVRVPGISRMTFDRVYGQVAPHMRPDEFLFTRLVDPGQIYARITVAEQDRLTRDAAIRIGRGLGADQVVTGRVYGMRSSTNTTQVYQQIFRRIVDKDTAGVRRERYVEQDFHAVERERTVSVRYDFEVVDTRDENTLGNYSDEVEGYARVVFTDFQANGNCSDYCVVPPGLKKTDSERAEQLQSDWNRHFGTWKLPDLLEQARKDRHRTRYTSSDRRAFYSDCRERPVWLGGLPADDDMAVIALDPIWQPVLGMLKELDTK